MFSGKLGESSFMFVIQESGPIDVFMILKISVNILILMEIFHWSSWKENTEMEFTKSFVTFFATNSVSWENVPFFLSMTKLLQQFHSTGL